MIKTTLDLMVKNAVKWITTFKKLHDKYYLHYDGLHTLKNRDLVTFVNLLIDESLLVHDLVFTKYTPQDDSIFKWLKELGANISQTFTSENLDVMDSDDFIEKYDDEINTALTDEFYENPRSDKYQNVDDYINKYYYEYIKEQYFNYFGSLVYWSSNKQVMYDYIWIKKDNGFWNITVNNLDYFYNLFQDILTELGLSKDLKNNNIKGLKTKITSLIIKNEHQN